MKITDRIFKLFGVSTILPTEGWRWNSDRAPYTWGAGR